MAKNNAFSLMGDAVKGIRSTKVTLYVKKLSVDMDQEHLDIITNRQRMKDVHLGTRGVIWEALELLAEKYALAEVKSGKSG